ncbi:hypothetical protein L3X38_028608 [Prunus dulcis]|uniref:Uncharacterized protein n=1 Tax=Prunus dulcis TaxID=3755 RepID=A0AAD4Z1C7_PRUDU|nr:hypothetical protein L3X38_028608 [Prunus dulcis]
MALLCHLKENTPPRPDLVEPPPLMIDSSLFSIVSDYKDQEYFNCKAATIRVNSDKPCLALTLWSGGALRPPPPQAILPGQEAHFLGFGPPAHVKQPGQALGNSTPYFRHRA